MNAAGSRPIPLTRPAVGAEELSAVGRVLESGWLAGQGPEGTRLEAGFEQLTGRSHAVAVSSCTAGLHLALRALDIGPADEVLVADYSFPATAHAVRNVGAVPVFVDVVPETGTMDPDALAASMTARTRAVVAVDALGMPADWDRIVAVAAEAGLPVVADAACSAGSIYQGRPCGSFGDVAVFSLHARKGITSGEGGVVVSDNEALAQRVRRESGFGVSGARDREGSQLPLHAAPGFNYKLSDVLAAIGAVQLSKLPDLVQARRQAAARYDALLSGVDGLAPPHEPTDRRSCWQTYAVTLSADLPRDLVLSGLRARGIGSAIGTYAQHEQPIFASARRCPVSADLALRQVAIPMFAGLTEEEQVRVAEALAAAIRDVS